MKNKAEKRTPENDVWTTQQSQIAALSHPPNETWLARLTAHGAVRDQALGELRQLLVRRLHTALQGRVGLDDDLIEDVVQDALMKTLDSLTSFQGRSAFTTWVTSIAVRTAFSELRRRRWKDVSLDQVVSETEGSRELAVDTQPSLESNTERAKLVAALYSVIEERLTPKQREALLAELHGMPLEEIGRRMGRSRNAVYKLTHDARKQLKHGLETLGYTSADWRSLNR